MWRYVPREAVVGLFSALPYALVLQQRQLAQLQANVFVNGIGSSEEAAALCQNNAADLLQEAAARPDAVAYAVTAVLGCTFGFKEFTFLAASLVLHVLNAVLLYKFCCKFASGRRNASDALVSTGAMFASIIFAVHPMRSEVVCNVSNLAYSATLFLGLCSTLTFLSAFRTRSLLMACIFAAISASSYALASTATIMIAPLPAVYVLGVLGGYQRSQPLLGSIQTIILNGVVVAVFGAAIVFVGQNTLSRHLTLDELRMDDEINPQRIQALVYSFHQLLLSHIYPSRLDVTALQSKSSDDDTLPAEVLRSLAIQLVLFTWSGLHIVFALLRRKAPQASSIIYFALLAMYSPTLLTGETAFADHATYLPACIFAMVFTVMFIDTALLPSVATTGGTDVVMLVRMGQPATKDGASATMLHCRRSLFGKITAVSWALVLLLLATTCCTTQLLFAVPGGHLNGVSSVPTTSDPLSTLANPVDFNEGNDSQPLPQSVLPVSDVVVEDVVEEQAGVDVLNTEHEQDHKRDHEQEYDQELQETTQEAEEETQEVQQDTQEAEAVGSPEAHTESTADVGVEDTPSETSAPTDEDLTMLSADPITVFPDCDCAEPMPDSDEGEALAEEQQAQEQQGDVEVIAVEAAAAEIEQHSSEPQVEGESEDAAPSDDNASAGDEGEVEEAEKIEEHVPDLPSEQLEEVVQVEIAADGSPQDNLPATEHQDAESVETVAADVKSAEVEVLAAETDVTAQHADEDVEGVAEVEEGDESEEITDRTEAESQPVVEDAQSQNIVAEEEEVVNSALPDEAVEEEEQEQEERAEAISDPSQDLLDA